VSKDCVHFRNDFSGRSSLQRVQAVRGAFILHRRFRRHRARLRMLHLAAEGRLLGRSRLAL